MLWKDLYLSCLPLKLRNIFQKETKFIELGTKIKIGLETKSNASVLKIIILKLKLSK